MAGSGLREREISLDPRQNNDIRCRLSLRLVTEIILTRHSQNCREFCLCLKNTNIKKISKWAPQVTEGAWEQYVKKRLESFWENKNWALINCQHCCSLEVHRENKKHLHFYTDAQVLIILQFFIIKGRSHSYSAAVSKSVTSRG